MKNILAKAKGSVLAYSLILLAIVLTASIGMMSSSVVNFRSVSMSDKSGSAFQIADSGAQAMIANIKKSDSSDKIKKLFNSPSECSNPSFNLLTGKYRVSFYDGDEVLLGCDDDIAKIASIKSVGTYSDTTRAVQVAVAAGGVGTYQMSCMGLDISCYRVDTRNGEVEYAHTTFPLTALNFTVISGTKISSSDQPVGTFSVSAGHEVSGIFIILNTNTGDKYLFCNGSGGCTGAAPFNDKNPD